MSLRVVANVTVTPAEIEALQHAGDWRGLTARMVGAAWPLEAAGAELLLICTNTMHRMAAGYRRVGLLGTAFTMEHEFCKGRPVERHGVDVIVPGAADRAPVHRVIYEELVAGKVTPAAREAYRAIIARLVAMGAEAVILGRAAIMVLIRPQDGADPIFDTTAIHAAAAVELAPGG